MREDAFPGKILADDVDDCGNWVIWCHSGTQRAGQQPESHSAIRSVPSICPVPVSQGALLELFSIFSQINELAKIIACTFDVVMIVV